MTDQRVFHPGDEARAVRALRVMRRQRAHLWEAWAVKEQVSFVLATVLHLGPAYGQADGLRRLHIARADTMMYRRALEIIGSHALVDDHPVAGPLVPLTHGTS
jgi:hypothetical protein